MSAGGFLLIVIAALLLFGPNKLPELGRAVGRTFREFKEATRDIVEDQEKPAEAKKIQTPPVVAASQSDDRRLPE
ncbi:sec-independent protein translocase protein TatA [Fontibacillus solani]|uniref:Sec-independent protein translocase protein TatA n=2 Tax=Fontibacillus TaxID=995014 RepID=A0A1G7QYZ2_9BACL|nr:MULTISPECIES: twin-arginine translocase TatA/TatE family subunit [Fontibacillus]MBA9087219.1 sec-independent protein translocase protein TatA [Fontibacillus solani]SDG03099.1 sec-independent protein translocase protein TatA [Fontibacillus panacisegetis]